MITNIVLIVIYLFGFLLSYGMQRVEHEAEGETYTKGDRLLCFSLSLLSVVWVIVILISAWVSKVGKTGYWKSPVKPIVKPTAKAE